jgi:hypothetical protein
MCYDWISYLTSWSQRVDHFDPTCIIQLFRWLKWYAPFFFPLLVRKLYIILNLNNLQINIRIKPFNFKNLSHFFGLYFEPIIFFIIFLWEKNTVESWIYTLTNMYFSPTKKQSKVSSTNFLTLGVFSILSFSRGRYCFVGKK